MPETDAANMQASENVKDSTSPQANPDQASQQVGKKLSAETSPEGAKQDSVNLDDVNGISQKPVDSTNGTSAPQQQPIPQQIIPATISQEVLQQIPPQVQATNPGAASGAPNWDRLGLQWTGKPSIWTPEGSQQQAAPGQVPNPQQPGQPGESRFSGVLSDGRPPMAPGKRRSITGETATGPGGPAYVPPKVVPMAPPQMEPSQDQEINDLAAIWSRVQASQNPFGAGGQTSDNILHRRSSTTPYKAPWEPNRSQPAQPPNPTGPPPYLQQQGRFQAGQRRFSLSPNLPSATTDGYDSIGMMRRGHWAHRNSLTPEPIPIRRHSVAGPLYHAPGRFLSEAFNTLHIDENAPGATTPGSQAGIPMGYSSLLEDFEDLLESQNRRPSVSASSEVGKGIALHSLPHDTKLYIVEFKAGRSDIFYISEVDDLTVKKGDLVIVEADRGKDLGKVINDSITPYQIHMLQAQHSEALNDLHRVNREIHPKRIHRLAEPSEVAMLVTKSQDEAKGLSVCQTKVRQKKLDMEVVDAEYQWDRRKLTFYFVANKRIDFRELVRDLFKIYKTRIWMCAVNPVIAQAQPRPMPPMMKKEKQF